MKYMPVTIDNVLIISIFVALVFLPVILTSLNFKVEKNNKNNFKNSENKLFLKLEFFFKKAIKNYKKSV